jgi:hypothetical protein
MRVNWTYTWHGSSQRHMFERTSNTGTTSGRRVILHSEITTKTRIEKSVNERTRTTHKASDLQMFCLLRRHRLAALDDYRKRLATLFLPLLEYALLNIEI